MGPAPRPVRGGGVYGAPPGGGSKPAWLTGWRGPAIIAAAIVVMIGAVTAVVLSLGGGDKTPPGALGTETGDAQPSEGQPSEQATSEPPQRPADEQCTPEIMSNPRWVCITGATIDNNGLTITYTFADGGTPFNINGGFHVHFYGADASGATPPDSIMGTHANQRGQWYIDDQQPSYRPAGSPDFNLVAQHPKVCARIANGNHGLVPDNSGNGTYKTGNCWPITRL
ncbi:MAG: hypothetical protein IRY85_17125 [Micromonosporaceae bacterium]|nr:hypothetical protein [Micromonosporaceae bacterium]